MQSFHVQEFHSIRTLLKILQEEMEKFYICFIGSHHCESSAFRWKAKTISTVLF